MLVGTLKQFLEHTLGRTTINAITLFSQVLLYENEQIATNFIIVFLTLCAEISELEKD